jgi:hypothetical protein
MKLIELAKLHRVALRSFHQSTLVCRFCGNLCCRFSGRHRSSDYINWEWIKKSRA